METLARKSIIMAALALFTLAGYAQNYTKMREAFKESYTLENEGDYSGAIDKVKEVFDEDSYEVNLRLGWLNYNAGMYTESASFYRRAISLMPYSIEAKFGLALPVYAQGNVKEVIRIYMDVLKIDSKNYTANYRLGSIYYGREDYTTAYSFLEKLVNMYPFDYDALHMFGWTNYRLGKMREAKVLFNKALMNQPNDDSAKKGLEMIK